MTCECTELDLLAYLTGELNEEEAAQVRDHLATCASCAAEAEELRAVSQHLVTRMKEIPPALDIPPLVSARIERALKEEQRQARKRSWLPGLGVVAAAAAAVLVSFSVRPDLAEKVAEVPVLGMVASPFLQPDYDVPLSTMPSSVAAAVGAVQRKEPNVTATANGISVTVTRVDYRSNQTQLWYRVRNSTLLEGLRNPADFAPVIEIGGRPATRYRLTADQRGADVLFQVTFEAVNPGVPIAMRLDALPLTTGTAKGGPWTFTIK
jgi:anti-sigma factor RsiW